MLTAFDTTFTCDVRLLISLDNAFDTAFTADARLLISFEIALLAALWAEVNTDTALLMTLTCCDKTLICWECTDTC
jgi:hypothetical protein